MLAAVGSGCGASSASAATTSSRRTSSGRPRPTTGSSMSPRALGLPGPERSLVVAADQIASLDDGDADDPHDDRLDRPTPDPVPVPEFDVLRYVEEFEDAILPGLPARRGRRGVAGRRRPGAQHHPARDRRPTRDFSRLAPQLPQFLAEHCVGCMACVSACPDSALIATRRARGGASPTRSRRSSRPRTRRSRSRGRPPAPVRPTRRSTPTSRRGTASRPARSASSSSPSHCKGCGECVEVCARARPRRAVHDRQGRRRAGTDRRRSTRPPRDMRFFRSLPPTPAVYRNEKALADLMLGEHAFGYVGGAGSCAGCGEATAIRMMVAATRQVHGPESMGIVAATGCNTVFGSTYPFNPYLVPWTNSLFENAPAVAIGIRRHVGPGRATPTGGCGSSAATGRCTTSASRRCRGWSRPARTSRSSSSTRRSTRTPAARRRPRRSAARSPSCRRSAPPSTAGPSRARSWAGSSWPTATCTWPRRRRRTSTTSTASIMEANEYPGPGGGHRLHGLQARARHRRRRREPPGAARGRLARVPAVHLRPAARRPDQRAAVAAGQPGDARRLGDARRTASPSTSCRSPGPRDASRRTSVASGEPTPEILATQRGPARQLAHAPGARGHPVDRRGTPNRLRRPPPSDATGRARGPGRTALTVPGLRAERHAAIAAGTPYNGPVSNGRMA